jgi:hypothetical protein
MSKYLIWWTSQEDHERVSKLTLDWPSYLVREFSSREGRPGRGRLWVSSEHDGDPGMPNEAEFDDKNPLCHIASNAGGIVFPFRDLHHVMFLPGFITDFAMKLPPPNAMTDGE